MWGTHVTVHIMLKSLVATSKNLFFQLTFGLLTLLVGLLAFWSVSPATIRPFVLHCFLVGR